MDVFGTALMDCYQGKQFDPVLLNNNYGEPEEMPMEVFFREFGDISDMEREAIRHCKGSVLDIGAGAGSISLELQKSGSDVTALEISEPACEIMASRGVRKIVRSDIFRYSGERYDTLLLLMNGIGLAGTLDHLHDLLLHLKTLIKPGGQVLFDSSDITYLYQDGDMPEKDYHGNIRYQYVYKEKTGPWFNWLYVDYPSVLNIAAAAGWASELICSDENDQYLARLTLIN